MIIGYARTSTIDQAAGFESQLKELEGVKCKKIFREQTSSAGVCPQLETALEFMRESDVVVTKLDRRGQSPTLCELFKPWNERGRACGFLIWGWIRARQPEN